MAQTNNGIVRAFSFLLVLVLAPSPSKASIAQVWANDGGDKVTRDELRLSNGTNVTNSAWDGTTILMSGAQNEVVSVNVVLEAPIGASNVSVSFNTLTGPNGAMIASVPASGDQVFGFVNRNIELFYVRYLAIRGLSKMFYVNYYDERHVPQRMRRPWSGIGVASGTWQDRPDHDKYYPEIAVPLELLPAFNIAAGQNQSIWVDVYVPKNTPAGQYFGSLVVRENGVTVKTVPAQLNVYGFALPDTPSAKTMVYFSSPNINRRYLASSDANGYIDPNSAAAPQARLLRDRHFLLAHRHRISLIGDGIGGDCNLVVDQPCPEWQPRLSGSLFTAANGYDGPGVNTGNNIYSIGTYGSWTWQAGGQSSMNQHSDAWVTWFDQNAFSPLTEFFLYLIDESPNTAQTEGWARSILNNPGPGQRLKSMATIPLPTAASGIPSLDIPTSALGEGIPSQWQPLADQYTSDARKRFYMYNSQRPASGSFATEDDGVALRELAWVQYKKHINRWFFWESTYYKDYSDGIPEQDLFQTAKTFGENWSLDSVQGQTSSHYQNGDGVLFYPGTDLLFPVDSYGVNGPFASLRLKHWRRGLQDVDYLSLAAAINPAAVASLVTAMVPKALWEYGVDAPSDPTYVHTDISWSNNPDTWEAARKQLANIIAPPPSVASISPASGAQGGSVAVTLSGSNLSGATINVGAGITPSQVVVNLAGTQITAMFTIAASAATGSYSVTVTTADGTSGPVILTVNASPGQITLQTPLSLSPMSPAVGQTTTATFTVQNTGGQPIIVQYVLAGARNPSNANVDFPVSPPLTIQPGQIYNYQQSQAFATPGTYNAWPAYYDGVNWIELAVHASFTVDTNATVRIEQNDPRIVQGPYQWSWTTGSNASASGGTYIASSTAGSTLTFPFTGTGISVIGIMDSCSGQASVNVDGVIRTFDAYRASGGGWQQVLYSVAGLSSASHTFTLTALGTKQAASCWPGIGVDAFDLLH
jgi:hypothetical protein